MSVEVKLLTERDVPAMQELLRVFAEAFDDAETYARRPPSVAYLGRLLGGESFIALTAVRLARVVGGIAAYELKKFEQERSEIYIYDLAVSVQYRRQGIATALIQRLQQVAADRGAIVIFVQADTDEDDEPAIALYSKLGAREEVLHFDIPIAARKKG